VNNGVKPSITKVFGWYHVGASFRSYANCKVTH